MQKKGYLSNLYDHDYLFIYYRIACRKFHFAWS